MPTYLLIAIGGACGSILRAWLSSSLPAITGSALPWPTIIINIVGSFVIGYVGMLTASDSRFAASPEIRAFILVGICGGFTTFSSFSQQTVDLLRDGRGVAAFINVALSVMLCLLSTFAGYAAATATRGSRLASNNNAPHIVVALHDPAQTPGTLETVRSLVQHHNDDVTLLAIDGPELGDVEPFDTVLSPARRAALIAQRSQWHGEISQELNAWVSQKNGTSKKRWIDVRGDGLASVLEYSRNAKLMTFEHADLTQPAARGRLRAALHRAHCPILLLPEHYHGPIGFRAALAAENEERLHALLIQSTPWLAEPDQVFAIHLGPLPLGDVRMPQIVEPFDNVQEDAAAQLLRIAVQKQADLLVLTLPSQIQRFDKHLSDTLADAPIPVLIQPRITLVV
ncbi:fluoride efflux transporter CrcB [Kozakia baliensis]|uniref:fluoride efflux transporter CrcB n=1 Tax=Kozakia baliensis TaxID=153496 RepID=UPI00345B71D8